MWRLDLIALFAVLATGSACAQQAPPAPPHAPPPEHVTVYAAGRDIKAPVLVPFERDLSPHKKCKLREDGSIVFSLLVDTAGQPRDIMFLRPLGTDLDRFALTVAQADRFKPGTRDGKPVVVAIALQMYVQTCVVETVDEAAKPASLWMLRSMPQQRIGKMHIPPEDAILAPDDAPVKPSSRPALRADYFGAGVIPPALLFSVPAEYTQKALAAAIRGYCLISLTVDAHGLPQNVQVARSLDPGLDVAAVYAVSHYRFTPALRNGEPIASVITVRVDFTPPELVLE